MSSNFWYQPFKAVSGNLGGQVPVVDDVLLSHEQENYLTTSLDGNCIGFEFQNGSKILPWFETDGLGFENETYQGSWLRKLQYQRSKKLLKEEVKAKEEETVEKEAPVPLVNHVNNILLAIFSNVEVHVNNQRIYYSNALYAHKFYISNNFKGAVSEYKGVLLCEGYDYEAFPDEAMEAPLSEPFFHKENENA